MSRSPGTRVGKCEIVREIGRGGMGVVYLARDTELGREVAVKALPDEVAQDPERLERFQREAKLLASLNHSRIATIYGLEEADGRRYMVLEFLPGETLAERLDRGALRIDEALSVGLQIAEAVEAAHEEGIVHRDLKPGNIKFTSAQGDTVKVLDFGLAKAVRAIQAGEPGATTWENPDPSPIGESLTVPGLVLGTVGYLSPEQAQGQPVDKRTDIFSFGCVLFEMLAGAAPFQGKSAQDLIGAVIHKEPNWVALPPGTPREVRRLLERCLSKDTNQRLRDIGDARLELADVAAGRSGASGDRTPPSEGRTRRRFVTGLFVLAAAAILTAGLSSWWRFPPGRDETKRSLYVEIVGPTADPLPAQAYLQGSPFGISRDGSRVCFLSTVDRESHVVVRDLYRPHTRGQTIPGTTDARVPFFSPDGAMVGFISRGKLRVVPVEGSVPRELCDAPDARGACWIDEDTILLAGVTSAVIARVDVPTGASEPLTRLRTEAGETAHRFPEPAGGTDRFFFTVVRTAGGSTGDALALGDLRSGEHRLLLEDGGQARYASGVIAFSQADGSVRAVAFDPYRDEIVGSPRTVLEGVRTSPLFFAADFAVSQTGMLAYVPGRVGWTENTPQWCTRGGDRVPVLDERRVFTTGRISPDNRYIAFGIVGPRPNIWRYDLRTDPPRRLRLTDDGWSIMPVWSPDSSRIVYASLRTGVMEMYQLRADGSTEPELLRESKVNNFPTSWSSDDRLLAYTEILPRTGEDLWVLPLEDGSDPWPVLKTPYNEGNADFSPDGKWIVYQSDETGTFQVYVRRTDGTGGAHPVSVGGGGDPVWRGDEIFFRSVDSLLVARVRFEPELTTETPTEVIRGLTTSGPPVRLYDIAGVGDAQRILVTLPKASETDSKYLEIRLITNWISQVKTRLGR